MANCFQLITQVERSGRRQTVWTLSATQSARLDPAIVNQACDGCVECTGAQLNVSKRIDVLHDGIAVFRSTGETRKDEKFWIG